MAPGGIYYPSTSCVWTLTKRNCILQTARSSLFEFATDRRGSLWLQNKLAVECDRQGKGVRAFETSHRWVFNELRSAIVRLSLDIFGNFVSLSIVLAHCSDSRSLSSCPKDFPAILRALLRSPTSDLPGRATAMGLDTMQGPIWMPSHSSCE